MIPVYVNVFNRLTTTRNLVRQIAAFKDAEPIIIDNASTYEPLLEWYETEPCKIVILNENMGHHAPWNSGEIERDSAPVYGVTDCDLDLEGIPDDAMTLLSIPFRWRGKSIIKSGFALRIDDLPEWQSEVLDWEKRFWANKHIQDSRFYMAAIDTTFALYESTTPETLATKVLHRRAVRSGGEYVARHMPWYLDGDNLDEENRNYFATANSSNSWKPAGKSLFARRIG